MDAGAATESVSMPSEETDCASVPIVAVNSRITDISVLIIIFITHTRRWIHEESTSLSHIINNVLAEFARAVADDYIDNDWLLAVLLFELLDCCLYEVVVEFFSHEVDCTTAEATTHDT